MLNTLIIVALGLSCALQMSLVASSSLLPRQEQCSSAPNDAAYGACAMQAAFGGSSIIPQLLPNFSPQAALSVTYDNVVLGGAQQLSPSKVFSQPSLSISFISNSSQHRKPYVVMGLSYQAPSTVKLFWLQAALQVDSNTGSMISSTAPIVKYISPNPLPGTGANEYIFLVFRDPGLVELTKQNPQWAAMSTTAFNFQTFKSTIAAEVMAGSYFKSTFDGKAINGQSPSALAATTGRQAPSVPQSTIPASEIVSSTVQSPGATNQTKPGTTQGADASVKAFSAEKSPIPTQIINPKAHSTDSSNQTYSNPSSNQTSQNETSSSAVSILYENSLKSLLAVSLCSFSLL